MEQEYSATCGSCGAEDIEGDDLSEEGCCPYCGSDDLEFDAVMEVDLYHPGPGPGWV